MLQGSLVPLGDSRCSSTYVLLVDCSVARCHRHKVGYSVTNNRESWLSQVGVVSFGESGNVRAIHQLGEPFSDAKGPDLVAHFKFLQDNTIADAPVAELLQSLEVCDSIILCKSSR